MEPSKFHELLFDLYPKCIITTNWDDLLEKTVKNKTLIYDVIKSDSDLVRSLFDRKIIKMHGDFDQQNFVFKEDDYLQYNQKFSLIENYIKGVFTTHTIVFLGYSYSDVDLKMILKWIDNSSKVSPSRYLLSNKPSSAQEKYLLNHNIFILSPKEELGYQDLYINFFNDLSLYKSPDEMIKRIVSKSNNKVSMDSNLVKLINEKFYYLRQYRSLIPTQIQNKFGNCSVKPCGAGANLSFHDVYLTYDYDKDIRVFYKNYISYLFNEKGDQDIGWFLDVLVKSGIYYISIDDNQPRLIREAKSFNHNTIEKYKNSQKLLIDLFQFNFIKGDWAFLLYEEKYEEILKSLLDKINFYIKNKNYIMATIYMANHDLICENIQRLSISRKDESIDKLILTYPKFNWKLKAKDFPDDMQKDLEFLIDFIDLKEVYKLFYSLQVILDEKIESATIRVNGGISLTRGEDKFKQTLNSTLKFLLLNDIFIDLYIEVKDLFSKSLEKYITFQLIEKNVNLDQIDFYILIKYFSEKKLKKLRDIFLNENATEFIDFRSFIDQVNVKLYLLNSFLNLAKNFSLSEKKSIYKGDFEIWLNNIICLLPMFNWSEKRLDQIFDQILILLKGVTQSYTIYENIMQFIVLNFNLYKKSTRKILEIFDIFMSKLLMGGFNGFDSSVLHSNILPNICYVISKMGYKYENELILRKIVAYYSDESEGVKRFIIDNLFLSLYRIGVDDVKGVIFDFVNVNSHNNLKSPGDFMYELNLISHDFPVKEGFVDQLNNFIDTHIPNSLSHLEFIEAGVEKRMLNLLDYIVHKKNNNELESCLNNFNEKIKLIEGW